MYDVRGDWPPVIGWLPNPFTEDLSVPLASVLNDALPLALLKWQERKLVAMADLSVADLLGTSVLNNALPLAPLTKWQEKKLVAAAGYTVHGRDRLFRDNAYEAAIADFDKVLFFLQKAEALTSMPEKDLAPLLGRRLSW